MFNCSRAAPDCRSAQGHPQLEMRAPEIGLQPDGGFQLPYGRSRFAMIRQEPAIIQPGFREIRFQPNRLLELKTRFGDLAARGQHPRQVQTPIGDAGLDAQRLPKLLLGRSLIPRAPFDVGEIVVHLGHFRIEGNRAL